MNFLPRHPVSRTAATLWLLACVALLVLTLLQHKLYANERSALAILVPVYFLGFPSGHIAVVAISKIKLALYLNAGFEPSILSECLYLWTFTVVLGYAQWFMVLPWFSRKCGQLCGMPFDLKNRSASPQGCRADAKKKHYPAAHVFGKPPGPVTSPPPPRP